MLSMCSPGTIEPNSRYPGQHGNSVGWLKKRTLGPEVLSDASMSSPQAATTNEELPRA